MCTKHGRSIYWNMNKAKKKYLRGHEQSQGKVSLRKGGQMRKLRKRIRDFLREEDGISTVEIILIIVVLIGLVIIFKSQLTSLVSSILSKITSKSQGI